MQKRGRLAVFVLVICSVLVAIFLAIVLQNRDSPAIAENPLPDRVTPVEDRATNGELDSAQNHNQIEIASFNLRIFSDRSRNDTELSDICELLSQYDLIGIQETRDTTILLRAIHMLKTKFGRDYAFTNSIPLGPSNPEIYAWLYRSEVLETIGEVAVFPDTGDHFVREPAAQAFRVKSMVFAHAQARFDFVCVNFHAIYGDSIEPRRSEAAALPDVYIWLLNSFGPGRFGHASHEHDILLLGDFNLPATDNAFDALRASNLVPINGVGAGTTIYDSAYDNIWYDPAFTQEYDGLWGIERFDETMFDDNDRNASLAVSDHRPMWAQFSISLDDD